MSAEDQAMLAKISQLAGQINRHKNQQAGVAPSTTYNHRTFREEKATMLQRNDSPGTEGRYASSQRGGAPYPARGRGYRVAKLAPHRNRSLVLNNTNVSGKSDADPSATSDASTSSWVTKTDRHLQLINSNIFERETQARTKAIENTRLQRQQHLDEKERRQLMSHFSHAANHVTTNSIPTAPYELVVEGIRFYVTKNGSKLVRVPGDLNASTTTPKTAVVGGVRFYRSKNGNLYRRGIIKAHRESGAIHKSSQRCRIFSTTGSCPHGPRCRYTHDHSKVAACRDFLQKGECAEGDACDLSHELTPERTAACLHFAKGNCTNPACRYAHVKVSPGALVCRSFGIYGYCDKGAACADRHVYECPDFSNTGTCKTQGCKLLHRERASVLRKASAARDSASASDGELAEDLSSDDDGESVDSNDVDSDEVDEFYGASGASDGDFATQKDFISF